MEWKGEMLDSKLSRFIALCIVRNYWQTKEYLTYISFPQGAPPISAICFSYHFC